MSVSKRISHLNFTHMTILEHITSQQRVEQTAPQIAETTAADTNRRIFLGRWSRFLRSFGRDLRRPHRLRRHLSSSATGWRSQRLTAQTTRTRPTAPSRAWTWCCRAPRSSGKEWSSTLQIAQAVHLKPFKILLEDRIF